MSHQLMAEIGSCWGWGASWVHPLPTGLAPSSVDRNQTPSDVLRGPAVRGLVVPWGLLRSLVRMAVSTSPVEGYVGNSGSICAELLALPL